jgi:hypothetical protein
MKFVDIELDTTVFRARLLDERSPGASSAVWDALPFEGRVVHSRWSGAIFHMLDDVPFELRQADAPAGFQHPGLVVLEPHTREISICYGQGRLVSPTSLLRPIPLAEIGGDLSALASLGLSLQFDGAKSITFRKSTDQSSPLDEAPVPAGRKIEVTLGQSTAVATLLEDISPSVATSFAKLLPLSGRASNTYSGGPLTRFWNKDGGPEGETPLETSDGEPSQPILYPGFLYYLPTRPWRGIRIPSEATAMAGASSNPSPRLTPMAKFDGDWSAFREQASRIMIEGAMPMSFHLIS